MNDGFCEEKLRLLREFQHDTKLYSIRVGAMSEATLGFIPSVEFAQLSKIASQAHETCREAHMRLLKHMEEHGC